MTDALQTARRPGAGGDTPVVDAGRRLKVPTEIREVESGELLETKTTDFHITPMPRGTCAECAVDHPPELPHNQQALVRANYDS